MVLNILHGNNLELLKNYEDNYFDSVVTDCPYGLGKEPNANKLVQDWIDRGYHEVKGSGFMGNSWDAFVPQPIFWKEIFRVLKPGGYVLAFFGTRTYDWGTLAIRLAGFEIRDMICWHYASGFPKSLNISKQIDKLQGVERTEFAPNASADGRNRGANKSKGKIKDGDVMNMGFRERNEFKSLASTESAKKWDGYGTALKPATENICMARKPIEGTVAQNVLKHGTGAINLDDCRIDTDWTTDKNFRENGRTGNVPDTFFTGKDSTKTYHNNPDGRFPSNVILDDFTGKLIDQQSGVLSSGGGRKGEDGKRNYMDNTKSNSLSGARSSTGKTFVDPIRGEYKLGKVHNDMGGASRFFYCAKTSPKERHFGCEDIDKQRVGQSSNTSGQRPIANFHPTVKPIALMRYLQRLVTPKGGITLDPFAGSGTSGCSASFEDIGEVVLMEMEARYIPIIEARTKYWSIEKNRLNYLEEIRVKPLDEIKSQLKMF